MFRNKSVNVHQFAMVPHADIPRSSFQMQKAYKTTFDAGKLIPIFVEEILPGDSFNVKMTAFTRMATLIVPIMDNLYLESFFFFVPCRLVWDNWKKFMGEQTNPGDSISFTIPQVNAVNAGYATCSVFDYMGLPTAGAGVSSTAWTHNALPLRAYNLIWNEWFRDENLQNSVTVKKDDTADPNANYTVLNRGKRHDYFTSCLPFLQKGTAVSIPLGTTAPVKTGAEVFTGVQAAMTVRNASSGAFPTAQAPLGTTSVSGVIGNNSATSGFGGGIYPTNLYADLSAATSATINALRLSFQIQKLLERDARGGTRYTEIVRSHFGVISPDARLQRPEYLGGGSTPIQISPIAQTSGTDPALDTPQANLAAFGTGVAQSHGFSQSFTEHGYVIGIINIRADLTYQQGLRKMWSRSTRYDFYFPVFAALGEQAVLNQEIYFQNVAGTGAAQDQGVFGYQERWAEYRYNPSQITGFFKSTSAAPLDVWHLAQNFTALPTLSSTFIQENVPVTRVQAQGAVIPNQQFLFDAFFDIRATRPMPMYSVPGLIDHF